MSKSQKTITNHNHQSRLALALVAGGLVAGCSGNDPWTVDPDGFDGIAEESFPLLANPCTINAGAGTMTLSVRTGETMYLTLRAADSTVIADGQTAGAAECAVPSSYKIVVAEDGGFPGTEKVFLDYINGTYSLGATAGSVVTPGITLALGAGSSIVVRGSTGVDKIYLGSTYSAPTVLQYSWINVSGDTSPDIRMTGVTDVKVSTGIGADIISADGGQGTGSPLDVSISLSAYGGPDADTLTGGKGPSLLDGGDGDDKFVQTATIGADNIVGGKGMDTVDYSVRTTAVNVTVCTTCSTDPSGCIAADTACRAVATTAKGTCDSAANTAKGTCDSAANTVKGTCDSAANTVKGTCDSAANTAKTSCDTAADGTQTTCVASAGTAKTACDTAADDAQTSCTSACGGVQLCIDGCDSTHTSDLAACDAAQTTAVGTCTTNHTTGLATCATTQTGALATCTATQTASLATCTTTQTNALTVCTTTLAGANSACDATEVTCQGGATIAACVVCTGDDGTGAEGDTVNDDVEIVLGSKANDTISATWAVCSDQATVPTVHCTLKGNEGDDVLVGSSHNDTIDGGAGNDVMQGGLGDDTFVGGAGIDTVSYADRSTTVKVSLDSTKLWVAGQNGAAGELDVIPSDVENLTGGTGNDLLRGNASANIIHGGAGNDTIEGGAGNDALYGDAGNDLLYGGAGNDMLVGGAGADTLVGGDGDDFIDATDAPAASDTAIDCDGVNDSVGTAGTAPGTADALIKDSGVGIDTGALRCEL